MTDQIILGRGTDGLVYASYFDYAAARWAEVQLPGGRPVLQFTVAAQGQRLDVYGVQPDLSAVHWYSQDGGATWQGPDFPPGKWSSGLVALDLTG